MPLQVSPTRRVDAKVSKQESLVKINNEVKMNKIFIKGANEIAAKQQAELNKLKHDAVYSKL